MVEKIHIGTSGWRYKHWKDDFYPKELKQTDWLSYYAKSFDVTEINTSFYRLPTEETVVGWIKKVPKKFLFCPKMSRYLTHMKKLNDPEEPLQRFFDIFKPMKKQLGPVLIQLPKMVKFNYDKTEYLFKLLKKSYREYEFVLEIRHDSWLQNDALNLMANYEIGLVISQSGERFPYTEMVTAKNIYIRFHGPAALYASSYSDKDLKYFAGKFKKWVKEGHEIWAFFNNDVHGYAPKDALRLEKHCN
jgi:uncharacterized protein YecE (DUF72 family)